MNGINYTPEMEKFLRDNALEYETRTLAKLFNKKFNANITVKIIYDFMYWYKVPFKKTKYKTPNILPIGSEVIKEINKMNLTYIKISNAGREEWVLKHRFLWEQAHGSIPKGCFIIFLDNNKFNFELDNLELVSSGELVLLGKYGFYFNNKEMTKTGLTIIRHRLATIKAMTKGMNEEEKVKTLKKFYKEEWKKKNERTK